MTVLTKRIITVIVVSLMLACESSPNAVTDPSGQAAPTANLAKVPPQVEVIPGRYIVRISRDIPDIDARAASITSSIGGEVRSVWQHALYGFSIQVPDSNAEQLATFPGVISVEPVIRGKDDEVESGVAWALDRVDERATGSDAQYYYFNNGGSGVRIYVVDSGINHSHTEFTGRIGTGYDFVGDGNGTADCWGHGTRVTSAAAGSTLGTAQEATIEPLRITDCSGDAGGTDRVIDAFDWIVQYGQKPAVVNISRSYSHTWLHSVDDAAANVVSAGFPMANSAGNDAEDACSDAPGNVNSVFTVAASESDDERWPWSDYGDCVNIFAPGVSVTVASHNSSSGTVLATGTSYSAPYTAGALALYLSSHPNALPGEAYTALTGSATVGELWGNYGSTSPDRLLYALHNEVEIEGPLNINESGYYTWTADAVGGDSSYTYLWEYSTDGSSWSSVGSSQSYSRNVDSGDPSFYLRMTVTTFGDNPVETVRVDVGTGQA